MTDLTSHLIGLLQAPISDLSLNNTQLKTTETNESSLDNIAVSSETDITGIEAKELANAVKCKEYREKSKRKRKLDEVTFQREFKKNQYLRGVYNRKVYQIKKLKEHYLEYLKRQSKCSNCSNNQELN